MTLLTFMAILGAITATAAAFKALKYLAGFAKGIVEFSKAASVLSEFQEKTNGILKELIETTAGQEDQSKTIADIQVMVAGFSEAILALPGNGVSLAITTFKAHTIHCPTPSYIIATSLDGLGHFIWANPAWYTLHGLGYTEAVTGQFWDCIIPEDKERVLAAFLVASVALTEFRATYTNLNSKTGVRCKVQSQSWPLTPYGAIAGQEIIFLGAVKVLDGSEVEST